MIQSNWKFVNGIGWMNTAPRRRDPEHALRTAELLRAHGDNLGRLFIALEKRLSAEPALKAQLARNVQAWSQHAGFATARRADDVDLPPDPPPPPPHPHGAPPPPPSPPPPATPVTVEAFWWGFHFVIPHDTLVVITTAGSAVNTFIELLGPETGPAAPFIEIAAALVDEMLDQMQNMDVGNGIYFSMTWLLPGVFVPTPI